MKMTAMLAGGLGAVLAAAVAVSPAPCAISAAEEAEVTEEAGFTISEIPDEIFEKMQGKSYREDCPIPREDLRYLRVLHKNLEGETLEGELVCHETVAEDLVDIFRELYEAGYPIGKIKLADEYDAVDEAMMTDNNTSCFNFRFISHTTKISKHGLGVAVDINTLYNPCTKTVDGERVIEPPAGEPYLDRGQDFPYKIVEGDLCYNLFLEHGFIWGGNWINVKDYQHFELPDEVSDELRARYEM